MGYLVSFILLLIVIVEYHAHKTWVAPSVLFSFFWMVVSFFASLRLFNLNNVGINTWLIIVVGVLSFVVGTKIKQKKRNNSYNINSSTEQKSYIPSKWYWFLFFIVGIYLAEQIVQTVRLMINGISLDLIRSASFGIIEIEGYSYVDGFFAYFVRTIFTALETLLIAAGIDNFFREKKRTYLIAAMYLVLGSALSAGGRWIIVYFIIEFMVCKNITYTQNKKRFNWSPKIKRTAMVSVLPVIIIVAVFFRITKERGFDNLLSNLYVYFCGCVPFLDVKIAEIDKAGIYSMLYAGMYGLFSFLIPVLRRTTGLGFPLFSETEKYIMTAQQARDIGPCTFNAFVTGFYYLYADFRYIGVILGMLIFGIVAGNMYSRAKTENNSGNIVPYMIIAQLIMKSIQSYAFQSADYVFVFIIMLIIYFSRRYKVRVK